MKKIKFFLPVFSLLIFSCVRQNVSESDYDILLYKPVHAEGFEIYGAKGKESSIIKVKRSWQGNQHSSTELFISRNAEKAPDDFKGQVLVNEAKRIVCMSSSYIAMLDKIGELSRVVGVSGMDYVFNEYVNSNRDRIVDVGYDGNVNYELMLSVFPDLVLLYGVNFASGMEAKLKELGIPFMYVGEYLEEDPLGKAEWVIALAEFIGKRVQAEKIYKDISNKYECVKAGLGDKYKLKKPKVMLNTPYGGDWFMPSSSSYMVRLIEDAGGEYIFSENKSKASVSVDMERAYLLASDADFWLNVGSVTSIKELKIQCPKFSDIKCVINLNVYNFNKRLNFKGGNDFWESGVMNPDKILADLVSIFHPELDVSEKNLENLNYYKKLK